MMDCDQGVGGSAPPTYKRRRNGLVRRGVINFFLCVFFYNRGGPFYRAGKYGGGVPPPLYVVQSLIHWANDSIRFAA